MASDFRVRHYMSWRVFTILSNTKYHIWWPSERGMRWVRSHPPFHKKKVVSRKTANQHFF